MEKLAFPLNRFETVQVFRLRTILQVSNESELGFILETDLRYHGMEGHLGFPSAPTEAAINYRSLEEAQKSGWQTLGNNAR